MAGPGHPQYLPCNGEVIVNGFKGDAVFRTGGFTYISARLAEGLPRRHSRITDAAEGRWRRERVFPYVVATVVLGSRRYTFEFNMFIMESVITDLAEESPYVFMKVCEPGDNSPYEPPEVMFGMDFMQFMTTFEMTSTGMYWPQAGSVARGSMRPFRKVMETGSFTEDTYETVNDPRVILLFDMDAFEVQVHQKPHHVGKPCVVTNASGRILAVSYEAKKLGINRDATPFIAQAKMKCKDLIEIEVPAKHGRFQGLPPRPDTSIAREASAKIQEAILQSLSQFGVELSTFELSSNDEFFVDITKLVNKEEKKAVLQFDDLWEPTHHYTKTVEGEPTLAYVHLRLENLLKRRNRNPPTSSTSDLQELRLLIGAKIASKIVRAILSRTNFQSSVGVGSNKLMAKIASNLHKPGSITIAAPSGFLAFSKIIKVGDIPTLGGKTGEDIKSHFRLENMHELGGLEVRELSRFLGDETKALQFLEKARGICQDPVVHKTCHETANCSRGLQGKRFSQREITDILWDLCNDIFDRMEFEERINHRNPEKLKLSITVIGGQSISSIITFDRVRWSHFIKRNCQMLEDVLSNRFKEGCNPNFESCFGLGLKEMKITATF